MNARAHGIHTGYAEIELAAQVEYSFANPEPWNDHPGYTEVTKHTINGRVCETYEDVIEAVRGEIK